MNLKTDHEMAMVLLSTIVYQFELSKWENEVRKLFYNEDYTYWFNG